MVRDDYYGTLDELRATRWTFWDADRRETSEKRIRRPLATSLAPPDPSSFCRPAYPAGCSETSASLSPLPCSNMPRPAERSRSYLLPFAFSYPGTCLPSIDTGRLGAQRTAQTRDQIRRESRGARGSLGIPQKPWLVALRQVTEIKEHSAQPGRDFAVRPRPFQNIVHGLYGTQQPAAIRPASSQGQPFKDRDKSSSSSSSRRPAWPGRPREENCIGYQLLLPLLLDQEATTRPELYLAHVLYCFGLCASPCRQSDCPRRYEDSSM